MTLAETAIHPTAVIHPGASIGTGVEIGPYCVIEPGAEIADECKLMPHSQILGRSFVGRKTIIGSNSVIGGYPQDKSYDGEPGKVHIGENCRFYENVTVHKATKGGKTCVKNNVMLMAGSHIGHNASIEQDAVLVNNAAVGGHAQIGRGAFLSHGSAVHQFGRIGELSLLGGGAMATKDVPPFSIAVGAYPIRWRGPNIVGLQRAGIDTAEKNELQRILKKAFGNNTRPEQIAPELLNSNYASIRSVGKFILESTRNICTG